jgi:glucosamine--fructose-6-phosphate aminotransferase (isomerizing)
MAAGLGILAEFALHDELRRALRALPTDLAKAVTMDWSALPETLHSARSALVIGRGIGLPVAMEAALKLKETAALHAEPYSAAEVLHGPIEIVHDGFPVLMFRQEDATAPSLDHCAKTLTAAGAKVLVTGRDLPVISTAHPATALIAAMASGYLAIEKLSLGRSLDPDRPRLLKKVTETV